MYSLELINCNEFIKKVKFGNLLQLIFISLLTHSLVIGTPARSHALHTFSFISINHSVPRIQSRTRLTRDHALSFGASF